MSVDFRDKAAVEKQLWAELEHGRFGMLGSATDSAIGFRPMTAFVEPEANKIWFFTNREAEIAQTAEKGAKATFIVMAKDQEFQACLTGDLRTTFDALHRDKYWSPVVAAWFPKGKDDPGLTLLCLTCGQADVWVSEVGALKFGWEIAKANLTGATPDVGDHAHLTFR